MSFHITIKQNEPGENMKKIKIGVIGLGHVADFQLKALAIIDQFQIVAICDLDISKKDKVDKHIPFFTNHLKMIEEINIDAVFNLRTKQTTLSYCFISIR